MAHVLVGVDSSEASRRVLRLAAQEARLSDLPLRVVHAWTTPLWLGAVSGMAPTVLLPAEVARQGAEQVLDAALDACSELDRDRTTSRVLNGDAGRSLVDLSDDAAMLVVGSHGETQLEGALTGSVAHYVLHHARCPVVLVPVTEDRPAPVRRVVVGLDGSPEALQALEWALGQAARHECPLLVLHAGLTTMPPDHVPGRHGISLTRQSFDDAEAAWARWLDEAVRTAVEAASSVVKVETRVVTDSAAWALTNAASPQDQLVVGSRGRGGFKGLLLGSVSTQCAHYARGVVVVVPVNRAASA
jgi:nucleotide-binding universal stress UspA family protein